MYSDLPQDKLVGQATVYTIRRKRKNPQLEIIIYTRAFILLIWINILQAGTMQCPTIMFGGRTFMGAIFYWIAIYERVSIMMWCEPAPGTMYASSEIIMYLIKKKGPCERNWS